MMLIVANGVLTVLFESLKNKILYTADPNYVFLNKREQSYDFNPYGALVDRDVHTSKDMLFSNESYNAVTIDQDVVKTYVGLYGHSLNDRGKNVPGTRVSEWICSINAHRLTKNHFKIYSMHNVDNSHPMNKWVENSLTNNSSVEDVIDKVTTYLVNDDYNTIVYRVAINLDDLYTNLSNCNTLEELLPWTIFPPIKAKFRTRVLTQEEFMRIPQLMVSD